MPFTYKTFKVTDCKILFSIVLIALFFRYWGIGYGLPFVFNPDEPTVVRSALGIRFSPNPQHFDWPHLYIYLNYLIYMVFAKIRTWLEILGLRGWVTNFLWAEPEIYYLLTRLLSSTFGALTAIPLYLIGKKFFGSAVGLIAALSLAILPFHVQDSHYALIDIPMLFFLTWGLYYALQILEKNETRAHLLSGIFFGLAASTKYNGVLSAVTIPLAHLTRILSEKTKPLEIKKIISNCVAAGFVCITVFIIGTPYAVLDYDTFIRKDNAKGALWQFTNVGRLRLSMWPGEFLNKTVYKLADDFGYTIIIGFFLLIGVLFYKYLKKTFTKGDFVASFITFIGLLLIFYVSGLEKSRSRYYFVAYPFIILGFSYLISILMEKLSRIKYPVLLLSLLLPVYMTTTTSLSFSREDTRVSLYRWLLSNRKADTPVYYESDNLKVIMEQVGGKHIEYEELQNLRSNNVLFVNVVPEQITAPQNFTSIREIPNAGRKGPGIKIYALIQRN